MPTTLQMHGGLRDTASDGVPQFRCFHRLLPGRHRQHLAATNQLAIIQITNSVSMDKLGTVFSFYNLTSISKMSKSKKSKNAKNSVLYRRGKNKISQSGGNRTTSRTLIFVNRSSFCFFFPLCRLYLNLVPQVCVKCCVYSLEQKPGKDCWCHQVWLYCLLASPLYLQSRLR